VQFAERSRALLLAVLAARDRARRETGKPMLVRLGFSRTFESEPHYRALAKVVAEHASALSGLDVLGIVSGSDREPMPPALADILESLRGALPDLTVHAGEFEGHASVDRTLALEPQGIGHGVHAVEDEGTLSRLRELGVTLEVCPTSNRLLIPTALARLQALRGVHPLVALQRAEVHAVLGSDDPAPMGTDFAQEWERAPTLGVDVARLEADTARRWKQLTR
jgi:adenosine deaminase